MNRTCSFSLEDSYQIRYESSISGYIEENRLTGLGGIRVKVLFFWLDIGEVDRSGDDLEFFVGVASANFPVGNFDVCPQCGCGMDCDFARTNGIVRKIKNDPFVSALSGS